MIQPNELRIGNWFYVHCYGLDPWEYGLTETKIEMHHFCGFENHQFEPIPLTPEILEKAGFSSGSEIYYTLDFFVITKSIDHQTWEFKIKTSWAENRTIGLRYVHQLQNLYFALTGTELEIKL